MKELFDVLEEDIAYDWADLLSLFLDRKCDTTQGWTQATLFYIEFIRWTTDSLHSTVCPTAQMVTREMHNRGIETLRFNASRRMVYAYENLTVNSLYKGGSPQLYAMLGSEDLNAMSLSRRQSKNSLPIPVEDYE